MSDNELYDLLSRVHEVLKDRWFISSEEDEDNDEEVISLDKDVIKIMEKLGK